MSYNMSLPSSTRSATSATQAILIHVNLGQHGHGYGFGIHGIQFVYPFDDAATASPTAAIVLHALAPSDGSNNSLLSGLSVLAIATTHNHHRAGTSASHSGLDRSTAPHRALLLWIEFLRGSGSAGAVSQATLHQIFNAGAADRWFSGGAGVWLPPSSSSPA